MNELERDWDALYVDRRNDVDEGAQERDWDAPYVVEENEDKERNES